MNEVLRLSIGELSARMNDQKLLSTEVLSLVLDQITKTSRLHSFVHVDSASAKAAAEASDQRIRTGTRRSELDGVPIALKDNFVTRGMPTTAGSRILAGWTPPYDASTVYALKAKGAVIVGKTNMDEFAMGSSTEHSAWGPTKNPWNEAYVPGGSSGGSAASVASRQVFGAFGTDTGGSVRQPAALSGVVGVKPTYGRVSRHGIVAFASSLDQVGPMARTVRDAALLLEAVAGRDPNDATTHDAPVPAYANELDSRARRGRLDGITLGVPDEYFRDGLHADVASAIDDARTHLEKAGATVRKVCMPHTPFALSTYYLIAPAEASSNLARYDGVRYGLRVDDPDLKKMMAKTRSAGFGAEVKRRIMLGTFVLSAGYYDAYYGRAQKARTLIRRDFEDAFLKVDALLTPTSPFPAFLLGSKLDDPLSMYMADVCTLAVNLAGVPAMSVPCGLSKMGLPIGLQLIGRWFEESRLFEVGDALESAMGPLVLS